MARKDTVLPVHKGPPQHHSPGQPLYPSAEGIHALPLLPGPLPITEVSLEHSDTVELLSHRCNRENKLGAAPHLVAQLGDELEASLR